MSTFVAQTIGPQGFGAYRVEISDRELAIEPTQEAPSGYLTPGLVDVHIHGAFGIDFMSATETALADLDSQLVELGYEAYLPTTVTASSDSILTALKNLSAMPHAVGFHLEGPFISPEFPGAQNPARLCEIRTDVDWEARWSPILDHPHLRVVTLAPELPNAPSLIERLSKRGVVVSMGHSNAIEAEAECGFLAGASHVTHLFNAMRGFHHREIGLAGYAVLNPELYVELIYDRRHVSREATALLLRAKPTERVLAISDGTAATGLPSGQSIDLWGQPAVVGDGDVRLADGRLAGSTITLFDAFRNLADDFGAEVAMLACSHNPRRAIGMHGRPSRYLYLSDQLELIGSWTIKAS